MPELTDTLLNLTHNPYTFSMDSDDMKQLERFTVLMYSRSCSATSVDEARLQLFSHGSRALETLPHTKAALYQHVKRAIPRACFFWKQSVSSQQVIADFAEWGWKLDEKVKQWVPFWTVLPDASSARYLHLYTMASKSMARQSKVCQGRLTLHISMQVRWRMYQQWQWIMDYNMSWCTICDVYVL